MNSQGRRVMVVDDRAEIIDSMVAILSNAGYDTERAQNSDDAIRLVKHSIIDLVIINARIKEDNDGLELLRQLKIDRPIMPVVVYTGRGSVRGAIVATKLGAVDYLEWPGDINALPSIVASALRDELARHAAGAWTRIPSWSSSAITRWAVFVLKAIDSPDDPKTLSKWARCAGVSYSALRETCYLVGVPPHDACDFTRALRAVVRLAASGCSRLTTVLDVPDRRSLAMFCERVGLPTAPRATYTFELIEAFVASQPLIPHDNEGLTAVRRAVLQVKSD